MEVYIRQGFEMTVNGERIKVTNYYEPHNPSPMGVVKSIIKDGKETITKITEFVKGSMGGLKAGDMRDVPPDVSTLAGKKPSSFNPQPDGRYGLAGQPNSQPKNTNNNNDGNNKGTQTSSEKGAGLGRFDAASGSMGFQAKGGAGHGGTGSGKVYFNSTNNGKTWENGRSQWTENPPTKVEVEETPQHQSQHQQQTEQKKADEKEKRDAGEKPQVERPQHEATHESTEKDHGSQAGYKKKYRKLP